MNSLQIKGIFFFIGYFILVSQDNRCCTNSMFCECLVWVHSFSQDLKFLELLFLEADTKMKLMPLWEKCHLGETVHVRMMGKEAAASALDITTGESR